MRFLLCSLALFLALAQGSSAQAEDRVAIVKFKGRQAAALQKKVKQVLQQKGFEVVVVDARGDDPDALVSVSATISKKKRWSVAFEVWNRGEEGAAAQAKFQARKPKALLAAVGKKFWKRLRKPFLAVAEEGESSEENPKVAEAEESAEEGKGKGKGDPGEEVDRASSVSSNVASRSRFEGSLALGPRLVNRRFSYKGDIFGALTTFQVPLMAALALDAETYFSQLGIAGSFFYVPEFGSAVNGNVDDPFPTTSMSFTLGARYRQSIAGVMAHVGADYGGHNFTIKGTSSPKPPIPNVRFRFVRAGAGARMDLMPRLAASAAAGYRHVLSAGEIESDTYFPRLEVAAIDARAALSVAVTGDYQVELAGTLERYFFSMNPEPGDAMVAGGAADQYLGGQLLLKYQPEL